MRSAGDPQELIDCIYAALLGDASWEDFVAQMAAGLPDGRGTMFHFDGRSRHGDFKISSGIDETEQRQFADHYSKINPLMAKAVVRPVGLSTISEEMTPWHQFRRSEFYNDFFRPMGLHSAVGITIAYDNHRHFFMSALTSRNDPNANIPFARLLTEIAPHLRRAFDFYRKNAARDSIGEVGASLLDAQDVGTILVGDNCRPLLVSDAAGRFLARGMPVRVAGGKVRIADETGNALLDDLCGPNRLGITATTRIVGPYRLTFVKIRKNSHLEFFQGPTVIILLEPIHRGDCELSRDVIRRAFGVTDSEARVITALMTPMSLKDIALSQGVSVETIKTQSKSVYGKLSVSGRTEMLSTLRTGSLRPPDEA
jgi:DNA-binding CsgD family transcriptional regulator